MSADYGWTSEESVRGGAACLEAALAYHRLGWSPLCLCPPDHAGVGRTHGKSCDHWGKRPLADGGQWKQWQTERATEEQIREWWRVNCYSNVGLALGPVSGAVRIDLEGEAAEARLLEISGGDLPPTPEFTSGKGRGLLYGLPEGVEARTGVEGLADGELRIQGLGAQTVLPPSRHRSGRVYAWLEDRSPFQLTLAPAPPWLIERLTRGSGKTTSAPLTEGEAIPQGRRDSTLTRMAGAMRHHGFGEAAILGALTVENGRCVPPLDDTQVSKIAHSIAGYEADAYAGVTIVRQAVPGVNGTPVGSSVFGPPVPISQLKRVSDEAKWLWYGYLSCGGITLLSSLWKAGKTTLQGHMLKAFGTGGFFCGTAIRAARILYVTEEHESIWAERRDDVGLGDWIEVLIRPFAGKPDQKRWMEFLAYLQEIVPEKKYDLVVFDTLSALWPVKDENDAAKVQEALMPLRSVSDTTAFLLDHHFRKSEGDQSTASRGSGALPAFVDTILELRRFDPEDRRDPRRVLTGDGRYKETPKEVVVELTADGYCCLGEKNDVRVNDLCRRLSKLVPHIAPGLTAQNLYNGWPEDAGERPGINALRIALREGAQKGMWQEKGDGTRGDPYSYHRIGPSI